MKIGIVTYHRANNVGAVLQNYALLEVLKSFGVQAETIDYKCRAIERSNRLLCKRGIKETIKIMMHLCSFVSREMKFNVFRKRYLTLSKHSYTAGNIIQTLEMYDEFWTGSDQVWNMNLNGNDKTYLLDFIPAATKGKYSYAGSFGYSEVPEKYLQNAISSLKQFTRISVREDKVKEFLNSHHIEATVVLDPTLLLSGEKWKELVRTEQIKKKYVFVYIVAYTPELMERARTIADENGFELWVMHYSYRKYSNCRNIRNASPDEFLNYILNAQVVLCSSFHAVCFSLLFHKNFYYALDNNKSNNNSRISSLCKQLGLERSINCYPKDDIDYHQLDAKLEELRKESLDFIRSTLADKL